ncbi:MAG TPA: NlpC/P60 family protein [Stellaceae bacterium]|nr:NlpC/P60 family protein [Stellaceae bacterium]
MKLDPRLNAFRADLADAALRGRVAVMHFVEGRAARVTRGLVPVRHTPRPHSMLDTFFHFGEAVRVFDEADGYAWCQSQRDGYVGYVDVDALGRGDALEPTHYVAGLGAYRYGEADLRSPIIDFMPRHAPVAVVETRIECRGTAYVRLDGGGFLPESCLSPQPPRSHDLTAAAALYLGCPYLWAGRSFLGLDCSGLVQEAFRDLGVAVPRDTDMQCDTIGAAVEVTDAAELRRNDLIYIPGHVMIVAGKGAVIHAYGDGMAVRQDKLAALMPANEWRFADFTVRRV